MSLEDGIATKGHRILIPSTLRRKALQQIHEGHQGVDKMYAEGPRICILAWDK